MKLLAIGHYREKSAWSKSFIDICYALDSVGVEVVVRPVKLGLPCPNLPDKILEMENRSTSGCSTIISYVLPHYFTYSGHFKKNIGMFCTETDSLGVSGWDSYCNLMDDIIVFSSDSRWACIRSGVSKPVHVIGQPVDVNKYKLPRQILNLGSDFKFYGIGEWTSRKNWGALIRAFHQTFRPSEPVSLLLKVNSNNLSPQDLIKDVQNTVDKIKKDMKLYPNTAMYKQELLITDYVPDETILDLHYSCDCYVSTSHGEAINLGCLDAIGFCKYPIVTNTGGMRDIINNSLVGRTVRSQKSPVTGVYDTLDGLFTGYENWESINIYELGKEMRYVYENKKDFNDIMKRESEKRINDFSYENIGKRLLEVINA